MDTIDAVRIGYITDEAARLHGWESWTDMILELQLEDEDLEEVYIDISEDTVTIEVDDAEIVEYVKFLFLFAKSFGEEIRQACTIEQVEAYCIKGLWFVNIDSL